MVRTYKRKTTRQAWSMESMEGAVNAVLEGAMGSLKASRQFNVPQTTIERYVAKKRADLNYVCEKKLGVFTSVFTPEQETDLKVYLTQMEGQLFGLTINELCILAFQIAERNNIKHPFNVEIGSAGRCWVKGFLKRNPTLTIRKPEATSAARAMGFNQVAVGKFFDLLENQVDKLKFTGDRIFNCDETGITVNPKGHSKIIALKGRRQVGTVTSAERGQTVTAEICVSASGSYVPPMLIYPRKRMQQEFETGLPSGAWAEVQETGWMTKELFLTWFKRFVTFTGASKERPVLLVLDGHKTHTKNLELIDMAREKGVVLLCLPPHCSHRLQPLDVAFMKPLSGYYENEVRTWLRTNPGKVVTLHQISSLFGKAFVRSATMTTAVNGFRKTGIWPVDRNVFDKSDFLPSATTDVPLPIADITGDEVLVRENSRKDDSDPAESRTDNQGVAARASNGNMHKEHAAEIPLSPKEASKATAESQFSAFKNCSPEIIFPIPKVERKNVKKTSNRRGKTVVLTESPYKNELMEEIKKKKVPKAATKRKLFTKDAKKEKNDAKKEKSKKPKKKMLLDASKPSCSKDPKADLDVDSNTDDEECLYCYDFSEEGWIRCVVCARWAHNSCAGVDSEDDDNIHVCVLCDGSNNS